MQTRVPSKHPLVRIYNEFVTYFILNVAKIFLEMRLGSPTPAKLTVNLFLLNKIDFLMFLCVV